MLDWADFTTRNELPGASLARTSVNNVGKFANGLCKKLKSTLDKVSFGSRSPQEEEETAAVAADHRRHSYISSATLRYATRRLFARESILHT